MELLIAVNPDRDSTLPYLMRLPLGGGMVFRTSGTWPRTKALYCYPTSAQEWPTEPEIVERVGLRSCMRRGAAIDLVLDRGRENRSQLVFTTARGRDAVFWQSPRTRKQARPNVRTPTARAAGVADLEIVADSHEQYPYRFGGQQVTVLRRALPCGDYGVLFGGRLIASVERKSLADLVSSLTSGKFRYALAEMAALPGPRSWSRTVTRPSSSLTGSGPRWSPTAWRKSRSAGRTCRSSSARPGSWPRNGPTG
ncbi:MAG: ERCC4 domain-containing protein, partial [Streptosporangiaceae bacterium]